METHDSSARLGGDGGLEGFQGGGPTHGTDASEASEAEASEATARQRVADLEIALERRTVIGQASGIVMERYGIDADAAFQVLVRVSSHSNRKVYDIACELVATRRVDGL